MVGGCGVMATMEHQLLWVFPTCTQQTVLFRAVHAVHAVKLYYNSMNLDDSRKVPSFSDFDRTTDKYMYLSNVSNKIWLQSAYLPDAVLLYTI